eukprot:m.248605 g.248605  ORF g.248605 m.248605 type:complete len:276 (-) comp26473_c0_seq1:326-1153(-)
MLCGVQLGKMARGVRGARVPTMRRTPAGVTWSVAASPRQSLSLSTRSVDSTHPRDVLDFWFGEGKWGTSMMGKGEAFAEKSPLWWGMKSDFSGPITPDEQAAVDNECRQFEPVIRAAGNRSLGTQWGTDDGRFAEMLLCDQLSRGAFRGTPDAMAFDPRGIELRRELYADGVHQAAYDVAQWPFFLTPGEHSEDIVDHKANEDIVRFVAGKHGAEHPIVAMLQHACDEHFEIIKRFGRYPHRNALYGRANTVAEQAWLDNYDELPQFAKSQLPPK